MLSAIQSNLAAGATISMNNGSIHLLGVRITSVRTTLPAFREHDDILF